MQSQTVSDWTSRPLGRAQGPALAHGFITPAFPTLTLSDRSFSMQPPSYRMVEKINYPAQS